MNENKFLINYEEFMDNVLITGANGFIGSHITEYFYNKGHKVSCFARKESDSSYIKKFSVKMEYGDIKDIKSLTEVFKNYSYVIHNAGYVNDWGNYKIFYETNVIGTKNVLEACKLNNIKNIIMTGTVSVYGEENCLEKKNEDFPFNPNYKYFLDKLFPSAMNYYRDTKTKAVIYATNFAENNNINLTILEPVWVFGEREFNTGFYEYLKTAKSNFPVLPGSKKNRFHVIYVKDLARAFYLAYKKRLNGVNRFIIGNNKAEYLDKIYTEFCSAAGYKKSNILPKCFFYPAGFILELIYIILNIKKAPLLTRARVNMLYDNLEYSVKKAEKILKFKNRYKLTDAVKMTVDWYRKNGYL